jgi:hypothetical protein
MTALEIDDQRIDVVTLVHPVKWVGRYDDIGFSERYSFIFYITAYLAPYDTDPGKSLPL